MALLIAREANAQPQEREKQVRILAKSLFRELKSNGFEASQIVTLSTELLGLVTTEMRPNPATEGDD